MCPGLPDARRPHQLSYISNPELKRTSDSGRSLNTGAAVSLCVRGRVGGSPKPMWHTAGIRTLREHNVPQPRRPLSGVWHRLAVGLQPPDPPPHCQRAPDSASSSTLGGKALPQPHEKPFPRGVPTPGKAGREPSAAPPRGWNTGRDQCGRRGVATLFQSGPGAFRWGPCPAPTLVLSGAAGDPQEPQPPGSDHR